MMKKGPAKLDLAKIVDHRPSWLIRWGITALWVLALLTGLGYYFLSRTGISPAGP